MKYFLLIIFSTSLSFSAPFENAISEKALAACKQGQKYRVYSSASKCEAVEKERCFSGIKNCLTQVVAEVDDMKRPVKVEKGIVECSGKKDCREKFKALDCSSFLEAEPIVHSSLERIYCATPNGKYKKKKSLVVDKKIEKQLKDARDLKSYERKQLRDKCMALTGESSDADLKECYLEATKRVFSRK